MRDAVNNDRIGGRLVQPDAADMHELRADAVEFHGIDALHQCTGESIFHAEENADFFHVCSLLIKDAMSAVSAVAAASLALPQYPL